MNDSAAYDIKTAGIASRRRRARRSVYCPAPAICAKRSLQRYPVAGANRETVSPVGAVALFSGMSAWNAPDEGDARFLILDDAKFDNGSRAAGRDRRRRIGRREAEQPRRRFRRTPWRVGRRLCLRFARDGSPRPPPRAQSDG